MLDNFGMGNVSPAISFILKPISYDLARANSIETSDIVRKSAYSFEIHNNNLRIFLDHKVVMPEKRYVRVLC